MKALKDTIKKSYFNLRRSLIPSNQKPQRLIVEKAKWYNDADSPVMFMIDDFTNAWHSRNGNGTWDRGGDWGGGLRQKGSVFSLLTEDLLDDFPEVKVTLFTVAGRISQYTHTQPFTFAEALNHNEETKAFFKSIHDDKRFEIAYHGHTHGTPGKSTEDFVQEWKGFRSVEEACDKIEKGKDIFRDVFGTNPFGGKYGGWEYNEFADESIDRSGFLWWCRDWIPRDTENRVHENYYEPQFFGRNFVVALPSTVHGFYWSRKQIDTLLKKGQIISVEEHIAPLRPDGRIQTPNIVDDLEELRILFTCLRKKNVWYATGSDIAKYFVARSQSIIYDITGKSFKIHYSGTVEKPSLTLKMDCQGTCTPQKPYIRVLLPDSTQLASSSYRYDTAKYRHVVNVPVLEGDYFVEESSKPA